MRRMLVVGGAALALATALAGCKEEPAQHPVVKQGPAAKRGEPPLPGALPADRPYASGQVRAAVLEVHTHLEIPGLVPEGEVSEVVRRARQGSIITQTLTVSDERGKLVFNTPDFYMPPGTELRYNPRQGRYVLYDSSKKRYWALRGSELGNLMEGGPSMRRTGYTVEVKTASTEETEQVAGMAVLRTEARIGFDWTVRGSEGEKKGKVKVNLSIWHTSDKSLSASWGDMMVDFLTVPFQDDAGRKVVNKIKSEVQFPLKWVMEVVTERKDVDEKGTDEDSSPGNPRLVTVARKVDVRSIPRPELASPPAGIRPAEGPYEFGEGGQTAAEELLSKLPARKGEPPPNEKP